MAALVAGALLSASPAAAKCASRHTRVWPSSGEQIDTEPLIVVSLYARSGDLAEPGLVRFSLDSERESVPLRVSHVYTGEKRFTQLVLRAERPLEPNTRYELETKVYSEESRELLGYGGMKSSWTTTAAHDTTPPRALSVPEIVGHNYRALGCGPARHLEVAVPAEGAALAQVTLERADGSLTTALLPLDEEGKVQVGHGMCAGPFVLDEPQTYRLHIEVLDRAGNAASATSKPLRFVGPIPQGG
jgi:hypothetical protein